MRPSRSTLQVRAYCKRHLTGIVNPVNLAKLSAACERVAAARSVGGAGGAVLKPKEPPERAWEACRLKIVRGHETDLGLSKLLVFEAWTATRAPSPNTAAAGDSSQ